MAVEVKQERVKLTGNRVVLNQFYAAANGVAHPGTVLEVGRHISREEAERMLQPNEGRQVRNYDPQADKKRRIGFSLAPKEQAETEE